MSVRQGRWLAATSAASALAIAAGVGLQDWLGGLFTQADTTHYLNLARGLPAMLPFASRQLEPLLVRALVATGTFTLEPAFLTVGVLALLVFLGTVAFFAVRAQAPTWLLVSLLAIPFWARAFNGLVLPDLIFGALVCGLLVLLWRGWFLAAAAMLLPLAVARESTALLLICLLAACWRTLPRSAKALAVAATLAGLAIAGALARHSLGNQEGISPAFYMLAKMPWNFARNFLGVQPWADVYPACAAPSWQHALHAGRLHAVGVCGFESWLPARLLGQALSCFGLLPLLLWRGRRGLSGTNPMLRFALVYGLVSFAMAGLLGDRVDRLLGYAWPAFLVAVPMAGVFPLRRHRAFAALHLALAWTAVFVGGWPLVMAGVLAWITGWRLTAENSQLTALSSKRQAQSSKLKALSSQL